MPAPDNPRDPLYGIRLKLDRAKKQLQILEADITADRKGGKRYHISPQYNIEARELRFIAHILQPFPGIWGVQVGEIVHNLRSALDHLVWELVVHHTGRPPTSNKTQFPIFETKTGYDERSGKQIRGVCPMASARIKSAQPFATGEGVRSPLWRLHELSNFDKHRTLHLTGAVLEATIVRLSGVVPTTGTQITVRVPGPFVEGAVILTVEFSGTHWPFAVPVDEVKMDGEFRMAIAFDDGCPAVAWALVEPLVGGIGRRVYETIERITGEVLGLTL